MKQYRVGLNDLLWEVENGKPRRLMDDEFMMQLYSHGVGCWNENLHHLQGEAIVKRLVKLETKNGKDGISKVARNKSRRKKRV